MNNIRTFREKAGLKQADLAELIGCTRGAICHYETGRRGMDIELCRLLVKALNHHGAGVNLDDVFPPKAA